MTRTKIIGFLIQSHLYRILFLHTLDVCKQEAKKKRRCWELRSREASIVLYVGTIRYYVSSGIAHQVHSYATQSGVKSQRAYPFTRVIQKNKTLKKLPVKKETSPIRQDQTIACINLNFLPFMWCRHGKRQRMTRLLALVNKRGTRVETDFLDFRLE